MTNIIKDTIHNVDCEASVIELYSTILVITDHVDELIEELKCVGEDSWRVGTRSLMIDRTPNLKK